MNCIRCGGEAENNQIFCNECLATMEQHPVKPGTPIQLPNREMRAPQKRTAFKAAQDKWANTVYRLRHIIFWLVVLVVLLACALALCICLMLQLTPAWINDLVLNETVTEFIRSIH